jgi:hypothetical protein
MMLGMEATDVDEQLAVRSGSRALGTAAPSVIAAGRDLEDPAHQPDRPSAGMIADEFEAHLGTSRAAGDRQVNMPIAYGMARPSRSDATMAQT